MPLTEIVELAVRRASPTEEIIQRSSMMLGATNKVCRASRFCINREVNDLKLSDIDLFGHQHAADLSRSLRRCRDSSVNRLKRSADPYHE